MAPTCVSWPCTVSDPHPPRHRFAFSTEEVRALLHGSGDFGALAEQVLAARVRLDCAEGSTTRHDIDSGRVASCGRYA